MDKADTRKMAKRVALELKETQYAVRKKIETIIKLAGAEFIREALDEAHRIEANGGLMTCNLLKNTERQIEKLRS